MSAGNQQHAKTMKQTNTIKPRFDLLDRLKKRIGRKACLICLLLAVPLSQVPAQQITNPAASPADAKTVDLGESITADGQVFKLKRIANQLAIKTRAGASRFEGATTVVQGGKTLSRTRQAGDRIAIWTDDTETANESERLRTLLDAANAEVDVEYASPVYQVEGSELLMCGTDELIVEMRPDTDADDLQRVLADHGLFYARRVVASESTHVVRLAKPKKSDVLSMVNLLLQDPDVHTARHNFLQELKFNALPSDPYVATHQWPLTPYAAGNADSNANIKADAAWSGNQPYGSPGIVVAILDNGFQLNHPDLAANFLPGYDFYEADADPSPSDQNPSDPENHGTAVAGIIAAAVNNSGTVGGAPNCKILPVRIGRGENSPSWTTGDQIKAALVWAADRADVISCSWTIGVNTDVTDGFTYAGTSGRKPLTGPAKGTLAFCASGNVLNFWKSGESTFDVPAGTWKFRFRVQNLLPGGSTTTSLRASLAYVQFPDTSQTIWRFDDPSLPPGFTQDTPQTPWAIVDEAGRTYGTGRYFVRSASTLPGGGGYSSFSTAAMQVTTPGRLRLQYVIQYPDYDSYSKLYVERLAWNGSQWVPVSPTVFEASGNVALSAPPSFNVTYPASLSETVPSVISVGASTDLDYRSDFSRYGGNALTFVAPGGNGYKDILTTDRTNGGYNKTPNLNFADANYTWFEGTSAAAPLAASVAALVLSRNGHLTAAQVGGVNGVKEIMITACDKVHQADGKLAYVNNRNEYVGFGRLNANAAVSAVTVDNTPPQFTGAYVQTTRTVDVLFNEPMGGAIYTPSSFTISGAGKGTLANNPSQIIRLAPEKYRLVWNTGGMVAGTVTIATSNLKDVAGNGLANPTSQNSTGTTAIELVNCGGSTVFPFGDLRTPWLQNSIGWIGNTPPYTYTTSGSSGSTSSSINMSGVSSPAPQAVYQSGRMRWYADGTPAQWLTYNLPGVLPGEAVKVRLHFSEMYWNNIGDQIFHLRVNNSNPANYPNHWYYDILQQTAGVKSKAAVIEFNLTHGSGPLRIDLQQSPSSGQFPYYNATINGIEVLRQ